MRRVLTASTAALVVAAMPLVPVITIPATVPAVETPAPLGAWDAFVRTMGRIDGYSDTVVAHEVAGERVEDRTYHVTYAKPGLARSEIIAGPGRGSVAVWDGGDTVRGHVGGLLAGIKITVGIGDHRATDIRGKTIASGYFPAIVRLYATSGALSESPGAPGTTVVTFVPRDPAAERGLTREDIVLSDATHLPLEHAGYQNGVLVERERFEDYTIDPTLPPGTFTL